MRNGKRRENPAGPVRSLAAQISNTISGGWWMKMALQYKGLNPDGREWRLRRVAAQQR